jgi:hypothetical protein
LQILFRRREGRDAFPFILLNACLAMNKRGAPL